MGKQGGELLVPGTEGHALHVSLHIRRECRRCIATPCWLVVVVTSVTSRRANVLMALSFGVQSCAQKPSSRAWQAEEGPAIPWSPVVVRVYRIEGDAAVNAQGDGGRSPCLGTVIEELARVTDGHSMRSETCLCSQHQHA
jgi:hypothetical protein